MNIKDILAKHHFNGSVLIYDKQKILIQESYGYKDFNSKELFTENTRSRIGSISKQMTATAIMFLVDHGLLTLDQTIEKFFPEYLFAHQITIHHLLSNTSGLEGYPIDRNYDDLKDEEDFYHAFIKTMIEPHELKFEPGTSYEYSGSGYIMLTKIIEIVSQMSFPDFMKKHIFEPLKMFNTGFDDGCVDKIATPYEKKDEAYVLAPHIDMRIAGGGGGFYSTIIDLYTWNQAIINPAVIKDEWVKNMWNPYVQIDEYNSYGYGFFIQEDKEVTPHTRTIYHAGGGPGVQAMNTYFDHQHIGLIMISNVNDKVSFHETRKALYDIILDKNNTL